MLLTSPTAAAYMTAQDRSCAEVQAWLAANYAAGTASPTEARVAAIDTYVRKLKTDGVWAKLDLLMHFGFHASGAGLRCLVHPSRLATAVNSPTFTTDRGFLGDGATSYIDLNFTVATDVTNYVLNSAGITVVSLSSGQSNNIDMGGVQGNLTLRLVVRTTTNRVTSRVNDATASNSSVTTMDGIGMWTILRSDSATKKTYKNDAQFGTDLSVASTAMPTTSNRNIWACGGHNTGFGEKQLSMVAIHGGLSATDVDNFFDAEQALQAHLGVTLP